MNVIIAPDKNELGRRAASHGAELIRDALARRGQANVIVATGASQFEMLSHLVSVPNVDWAKVVFFHLDEYAGMAISHPASFRRYLKERLVDKLPCPPKAFHYIDAESDLTGECRRLGELIRKHPIDVAFIGIGENGHLAFNDPPADFETHEPYILVTLDDACRQQQFGEGWFATFDLVPTKAISMSVNHILKSTAIVCSVPDERKAVAVRGAIEGPVTPTVPASILQTHAHATIYLDPPAASRLKPASTKVDMQSIDAFIVSLTRWFPDGHMYSFESNIYASLALVLVGLICGGMGGLVVGNRMAFFSDALAHCAFAGVALGLIFCIIANVPDTNFREWITVIMVAFGIGVGVAIAWVRDRTSLASDTVIGVFFAFSIGMGAIFTRLVVGRRRLINIESFIFGQPLDAQASDIVMLLGLFVLTFAFLVRYYNDMVLSSVNPSLAMSRRVRVTMLRYVFIVLLGIVINVCLQIVGTLLINGLLIVPAAAAANVSRNLRQHFWLTVAFTVACGLGGQFLSWELGIRFGAELGTGGVIVVSACVLFLATMIVGPVLRRRPAAA